jgi:hypothetical protein
MIRKLIAIVLSMITTILPAVCMGGVSEVADSAYWSKLVHEENSLAASVLYLPYLVLGIPWRCIDGIVNSKPASLSTIPPPAHRAH